ncbi:phage tail tube protein [Clostridium sp.]|uniref:phage tail tube protein n=1 Tax=Clostridium sp. TaxID=1506 RepID=UPI003991AE48
MAFDTKNIINGTYGEAWINDEYVDNVKGVQGKVEFNYEDVPRVRKLMAGKKMTGAVGNGSLRTYKSNSGLAKYMIKQLKEGKQFECTIISKLDDPDAHGAERVAFYGVTFNDLTLADWELATLGEIEAPFTFTDCEYLDMI